jgi:hypothetical protein
MRFEHIRGIMVFLIILQYVASPWRSTYQHGMLTHEVHCSRHIVGSLALPENGLSDSCHQIHQVHTEYMYVVIHLYM